MANVWGIKLGSGGRCVPFCEKHGIVGLGWQLQANQLQTLKTFDLIWKHIKSASIYETDRKVSIAAGQISRFVLDCKVNDFIVYYEPNNKSIRICKVLSDALNREADFDSDTEIDIWMYRKVEYLGKRIGINDFDGTIKGSVLGPRMSFWRISSDSARIEAIASGRNPAELDAPDPELVSAIETLKDLLVKRMSVLDSTDWEELTADYFRYLGAHVDEKRVGRNTPVIDVEATFNYGNLGTHKWRTQVKRLQNIKVTSQDLKDYVLKNGSDNENEELAYVSVYGFSDDAYLYADEESLMLLEAKDFVGFIMSGKLRVSLKRKLALPYSI